MSAIVARLLGFAFCFSCVLSVLEIVCFFLIVGVLLKIKVHFGCVGAWRGCVQIF